MSKRTVLLILGPAGFVVMADNWGRRPVFLGGLLSAALADLVTFAFGARLPGLVLGVILLGPWALCQAFIPGMIECGYGRVVNVSSGAGQSSMAEDYAPSYSASRAALNALTRMLADAARGSNVLVNAVCPGWVRTEMGGASAPRSVEEGADTIVWLATLPDGGPSGGFFRDRKPIPW